MLSRVMLKFKFHYAAPLKTFADADKFISYSQNQNRKWSEFLASCSSSNDNHLRVISNVWQQASDLFSLNANDEQLQVNIQNRFDSNPIALVYDSQIGRHIRDIASKGDVHQIRGALLVFKPQNTMQNQNLPNLKEAVSLFESLNILIGPKHLSKGKLQNNVDDSINDLEERFEKVLSSNELMINEQKGNFKDSENKYNELNEKFKDRRKAIVTIADRRTRAAKKEWKNLRESFIEDLKLETAVELWKTRAELHEDNYKSMRCWTISIGIIGLLLSGIWLAFGMSLASIIFKDETQKLLFFTAISVVYFTLFVWTLRIVIRSMMTENHLWVDASARSAMAHTYLALIKDGAASDNDRAIVLASLFNPVTDGLIKDDAMPVVSPTAMVANAITGRNN